MALIVYLLTCAQILIFCCVSSLPQNVSDVRPETTLAGLSSLSHPTNKSNGGIPTTSQRATTTESTKLPSSGTPNPKTTLLSFVNRRLEDLQRTKNVETKVEDVSQSNLDEISSTALADLILINYLHLAQQEGINREYQSGFGIVPQTDVTVKRLHQIGSEHGHTNLADKKKAWNWPKY